MKYYAPDYYEKFKCIADACRHSCCIGWEIDIDEDTLALYDTVGGEIGERLKKHICRDGDCAYFRLGEDERCPFLNNRNLCDIILELGDGALCDICADHPRFRNFYSDRTEEGLGLSCEEAARIILTNPDKTRIVLTEDDGFTEAELTEQEKWFFDVRAKLIEILQRRDLPIDLRVTGCVAALGVKMPSCDLKEFFLSLERLDPDWKEYLEQLSKPTAVLKDNLETAYEQLLVYLVYRHLKETDVQGTFKFCLVSYLVIRHITEALGGREDTFVDVCRRYSAEIEYSDENVQRVIDEL